MRVKVLSVIATETDTYHPGQVVQIDDETGKGWLKAKQAEAAEAEPVGLASVPQPNPELLIDEANAIAARKAEAFRALQAEQAEKAAADATAPPPAPGDLAKSEREGAEAEAEIERLGQPVPEDQTLPQVPTVNEAAAEAAAEAEPKPKRKGRGK